MEVEISPEPEKREAVLAAVEALLSSDGAPPAYRSSWREAGIRENVEERDVEEGDPVRAHPPPREIEHRRIRATAPRRE